MSRLKVIFFDAAGTLFHVKGSVGDVYLRYAEKYGVSRTEASLAALNAAFDRVFHDAPSPIFAVTEPAELKRCERLWWFDIVHAVFYRVGMFEGFDEYFEEVFQAFDGALHWTLYPETLQVLKDFKVQGMELGIISNFDTRLFNVLRGLGLAELLDTVTISSLAKAVKPSPHIFRVALDKHAVDPEEAMHVGDSRTVDAEGAREARIAGVWLNRGSEGKREDPATDFDGYTIQTLTALPELVATLDTTRERET